MIAALPPLDREQLAVPARAVWDEIAAIADPAPKLRILAHHPDLLREYWRLGSVINRGIGLDPATTHLLVLRTSILDSNRYGWHQRVPRALAVGVSSAKIAELASWPASSLFTDDERALLALVDAVASGARVPDEVVDAVVSRHSRPTMLGVTMLALYYALSHRLVDVLGVEPSADATQLTPPWRP